MIPFGGHGQHRAVCSVGYADGADPALIGRAALLDTLDQHPYARLTSGGDQVRVYQRDGAVVWNRQSWSQRDRSATCLIGTESPTTGSILD